MKKYPCFQPAFNYLLTVILCAAGLPALAQPVNVALNRPVTVDSQRAADWAEFAVDGDSTTNSRRWVTENTPFPHWIEIELGNSYVLSQLKFWTGDGGSYGSEVYNYRLQYWDGWDWLDLHAVTNDFNAGQANQSFAPTPSSERIRLLGEASDFNYFRVYEVEVFGELHPLHLVSRAPESDAKLYQVDQPITITFNRAIAFANQSLLRLRDPDTNQAIGSFTSSISGSTLTMTPDADLPWGTDFEVVIPAGTLQAADDATVLNTPVLWTFETLPETPQTVDFPYEAADLADDIVITFDRPLSLLDAGQVRLFDVTTSTLVAGTVPSVSGDALSISHPGLLDGHIYRVAIGAGAVQGSLGGSPNTRIARGVYGGLVTLLDNRFVSDREGWSTTGRWGWEDRYFDKDYGVMRSGDSNATKHARSPELALKADESYQLNIYTATTANRVMVGLADAPFALDMNDPSYVDGAGWTEIGRWQWTGTRKPSFSPPADGDYHLVVTNIDVDNVNHYSAFDSVTLNRAVAPEIIIDTPTYGSSFTEQASVEIAFDVLPFAGEITEVTVYDPVDERTIATFNAHQPEGYTVNWSYVTTPGTRDLQLRAVDSTGLENTVELRVTRTLADGSLPPLIHWDFDRTSEGWTGSFLRQSNDLGPGSLGLEIANDRWVGSPKIFLFAGQVYRVSFDHKALRSSSGYLYGFLPFPTATNPAGETPLQEFLAMNTEWDHTTIEFTVPADGGYHLLFWETASNTTQVDIAFDNFRLEGVFNTAPSVTLTAPLPGIRSVVGGKVTLSAEASDIDGTVTEVRFMRQSRILFTDTEPPYQFTWELPSEGSMEVHAVAYDNNNGFTATESVTIEVEANELDLSTYLGNASDNESVRQLAYQSDGTLVVAGILDPEVLTALFPSVTPVYLNGAQVGDRGFVARMNETGDNLLSLAVVGEVAVDLSLDDSGNIHVAAGTSGALKLDPTASSVLWSHSLPSTRAHRIDSGPTGMTVALYSGESDYDEKTLSGAQLALIDSNGTQLNILGSAGSFTTDMTIDETSQTVIAVGFKNFNTDSNPVDVPVMYGRDYNNNLVWRAYDWGRNPGTAPNPANFSNGGSFTAAYPAWDPLYENAPPLVDVNNPAPPTVDDLRLLAADATLNSYVDGSGTGYLDAYIAWRGDWDRWLNRPANNMADSRGARVVMGEDGYLYAGFEFDGGNTPLRYDPFSLDQTVSVVGGDQYHFMANTTTVPKIFVGRYTAATGDYLLGQWTTARLNSGVDNTLRLEKGDLYADHLGRVHITGAANANIAPTIDHFPGGYRGGAFYLALSPDFKNRELWLRFSTGGTTQAVAMAPSGRIALGGYSDGQLFQTNALQSSAGSTQDAFLITGDLTQYFSFQIGEHPRLFFNAADVADMRARINEEPFQSMYQSLLFQRTIGAFGDWYNPNAIYDVALRAQINGFLYQLTGDETFAIEARTLVEEVFTNTENPWASESTKGLALFWLATRVALAYDWCQPSAAWDEAFSYTVSAELLDIAEVIINNGGTEQNPAAGSNWQGARGGAGGLALFATDHVYSPRLADSAYERVQRYLNEAYAGSGWLSEGLGYFYFPVGNYVGPYGIALARQDSAKDLRNHEGFRNGFWAAMAAKVPTHRPFGWPGIKPDWSDDNPHMGGEGVYGLGFYYAPEALKQPYAHTYDQTEGTGSPFYQPGVHDNGLWDGYRGGTIWSYLYYPTDLPRVDPMESFAWHTLSSDTTGNGIFTWRDGYADGSDILAQFKARLSLVSGHDAPDGLGFRVIANGTPFVVGGGRNAPGRNIGQATVYPADPAMTIATNANLGEVVGTPLVRPEGDGHIIARMNTNNVLTNNHQRWFMSHFDRTRTGADAAFLVADTTANGEVWNLSTYAGHTVTVSGNTFTITAANGASMKGTVLYPTIGYSINSGLRERGSSFDLGNDGFEREQDGTNVRTDDNGFVEVVSSGGNFLIALTVVGAGEAHPSVAQLSGTVADAVVSFNSDLQVTLTANNILYDNQAYSFPDATVTFDPGAHGSISSGSAVQTVAYGGTAVAPELNVATGYVFDGWNKPFDPVLTDMTVTANYLTVQSTPNAPDHLVASTISAVAIGLTWSDNSVGETGFVIERSFDGTNWATLGSVAAETTSYSDSGLTPDTTAYYRVKATGTGGDSAWSAVASATTLAPNNSPGFDDIPASLAHEGIPYFSTIRASDPEDDSLAFTAIALPAWLELIDFGDGSADLVGTPDATETGAHSVTIQVSDGISAPVETTFTITVNARPVVTLDSPAMNPVFLPADVGLMLQVAVTDETANNVEWTQVDGPGALAFDTPTGLSNGVTATANGTYTLRATASDGVLSGSLDIVVQWGAAAEQGLLGTIVDFGHADLSTGKFRGNTDPAQTTGLDWDGDGADDSVRFYSFREDIPLSRSTVPSPDDRNFYGGLAVRVFNGTASISTAAVSSSTPSDSIEVRFDTNTPVSAEATMMVFWDKQDFRNGADSAAVSLGEGSEFIIPSGFEYYYGGWRWLVRNGTQYYISDTALANNALDMHLTASELASTLWAAYNPVPGGYDIDVDFAALTHDTPSSALNDITAVGLIWDMTNPADWRVWNKFQDFRVTANVLTPINRGPIVQVGADLQTEPTLAVAIAAAASDEGLPVSPGALSLVWSVRSGPSGGAFSAPTAASTSFTPSAEGSYVLRLTADDGSIVTFDELTVTASSADPFEDYMAGYPEIAEADRGMNVSASGDGIVNLLKFAFGLDPRHAYTMTDIQQMELNGQRLSSTFDLAHQSDAIRYKVQTADDLTGTWTTIAEAVAGGEMLPVAGVVPAPVIEKSGTTVTVHDILTIDDSSNDRRFMRVQIDYVAP